MIWIPCHTIVVGRSSANACLQTTLKQQNNKHLLWTISDLMDSDDKEVEETSQTEASTEHGIQILKSRARNILPSVHSAVAAASPIFSSYRSVFQNWKHAMPKLYKYPSSDIEVVVYRKNGDVEKLSNYKRDELKQCSSKSDTCTTGEQEHNVTESIIVNNTNVETNLSKPPEKEITASCQKINAERKDGCISNIKYDEEDYNKNDKHLTLELNPVPLNSMIPHTSQYQMFLPTEKTHKVMSSSKSLTIEDDENELEFTTGASKSSSDVTKGPICKFIYNFNTKISLVPSLERHMRTSFKDNCSQTSDYTHIQTETKATQHDLYKSPRFSYQNAGIQCNFNDDEDVTKYSQTEAQYHHVQVMDFSQTFPVISEVSIQTEGLDVAFSPTSTQTDMDKKFQMEAEQVQQPHTVEWHRNIPCCNVGSQTDFSAQIQVQENSCQAVTKTVSKFSQVENDLIMKKEASTHISFETREIGIQLSGSCCYFVKRKERKQFESKLNVIRKEIASLYKTRQMCQVCQTKHDENTNLDGSLLNHNSDSECSKSLGQANSIIIDSRKTLEEAKKYLDELGCEVEDLYGNTSLLKSTLESVEDASYFEDDWLQSNI